MGTSLFPAPLFFSCLGFVLLCFTGCPGGWTQYGTRCFYFYNYQTEWVDAERNCIALGANLASFHSHSEYIFLKNLVRAARGSWDRTWVGGYDAVKEGVWLWSDGSNFNYCQWGSGEPNNQGGAEHCMEINLKGEHSQTWEDWPCSWKMPFFCNAGKT
uniref:Galactose-specific lectin nattectin-like n=1 Tax=Xiphophorus maculatus TaxID=8083 RepID=A0A3B5R513_XIPMA